MPRAQIQDEKIYGKLREKGESKRNPRARAHP